MTSSDLPSGKTFRLKKIGDIYEQLTAEQIVRCMNEIRDAMVEAKQVQAFVGGDAGGKFTLDEFNWTDDASNVLSILIDGEDDQGALEYRRTDSSCVKN